MAPSPIWNNCRNFTIRNPRDFKVLSDSFARFQRTDGAFNSIDPLAEKYYSISPYAYCAGNPVNLVDSDGKITKDPDGMVESIIYSRAQTSRVILIRSSRDLSMQRPLPTVSPAPSMATSSIGGLWSRAISHLPLINRPKSIIFGLGWFISLIFIGQLLQQICKMLLWYLILNYFVIEIAYATYWHKSMLCLVPRLWPSQKAKHRSHS